MKTFQSVFSAVSTDPDMRSEFEAWSSVENSRNRFLSQYCEIGLVESDGFPRYQRPIDALADGWRLLAPPTRLDDVGTIKQYDWWFVKENTY